jgi:hypothetical protein
MRKIALSHKITGLISQSPPKALISQNVLMLQKISHRITMELYLYLKPENNITKTAGLVAYAWPQCDGSGIVGLLTCRPNAELCVTEFFFRVFLRRLVFQRRPSPFQPLIKLWNGADNFGKPLAVHFMLSLIDRKETFKFDEYNGKRRTTHIAVNTPEHSLFS